MAKKLSKAKRKYLLKLVQDAAYLVRRNRNAVIQAQQLRLSGFLDRQNRAYMAIYC